MIKKLATHLTRGKHGEKLAASYLRKAGLAIVEKNFTTRHGEIDLIAKDGEILVFVEVRLRQESALVSAAESITPSKLKKCQMTAAVYLQKHYTNHPDCRFDAVLITQNGKTETIEWLQGINL